MSQLTGVGPLARLILRRDRIVLLAWVAVLASLPVITVIAFVELFPTAAQRQQFFIATASQPAYTAMLGPGFGPDLGALATQRAGIIFVLVGLANVLTVIRHTRSEEEAGRRELLSATVVGRHAPLAATLLVTAVANTLLGALIAILLVGQGLPLAGSIAFGSAVAATGCIFAAATGVAAQLTESAGSARGIALGFLGATFLFRAAGDAAGDGALGPIAWLSPIGLMQRSRAFAGEQWWVFAVAVVLCVTFTTIAFWLSARRDLGAGIFPARLGRAAATDGFRSPLALAWRLQRGALYSWSAAMLVFGLGVGAITEDVTRALAENPQLADLLRQFGGDRAIADSYLTATLGMITLAVSAYAIQSVLRLRTEEERTHGDMVLATAVGRVRWATSHLSFAFLGPAVTLLVFGAATGVVAGLVAGDVGEYAGRLVVAASVHLPAIWVLTGIAVACFGALPRWTVLAWVALATSAFLGQFGPVLQLPSWVVRLSPFAHTPSLPGGEIAAAPLLALTAFAAFAVAVGLAALDRRDFGR